MNKKVYQVINNYRIYFLCGLVFIAMAIFVPNFLTPYNITNILKGMSLNAMVAVGFTIVMICKELDLSVGTTLTLGAMFVIGFQPSLGWGGSLLIAVLAGALVGLANGFLVARAKIDSFIVTLGTMTTVQGIIFLYGKGYALNATDFTIADWLETPIIPFLPPRVLITIIFVLLFEVLLVRTKYGRGFYMVGANRETAWLAGLNTEGYVIVAFIISGITAALGGALFAMSLSSATPTIGTSSLMIVVAATIIGGTSMAGGKGSILGSAVAVLTLTILYNGLTNLGAGYEIQILASGLVLAVVVLYEAYALYQANKVKGQRPELLKEVSLKKGKGRGGKAVKLETLN
ncbi:ABC transporter permease [Moorella stamsii]|nr:MULTISPECIES: ABC transporter permease [Moorella]